ncbi:MAG: hypothetical protein JWM33_1628, partial [Caulobacteraceae bacterium]|nr:hypothetical protein [Caulobacteraceae bacterium]
QAPGSRRALLIGGGAAALVVLGGAGLFLARGSGGSGGSGNTEKQVVTLANLAALGPALIAYGLSSDDSGKISAAAGSVLPADAAAAELRVALELARGRNKASLVSLAISQPDGLGVRVTPAASGFTAVALASSTHKQVRLARGQMDSESFYSSAVSAGLSDVLIPDFFQAFVYDFDFQREIEPGDVFEAAFEENVNERGEPVGAKRLIYASMSTKLKSRALYGFKPAGENAPGWYDGAGKNVRRSLMKTPVEGARISSTFGMRDHPVLGYTRMHKGTDFATPVGTPVFASGDGKISFLGLHGDHGNYIAIEHTPTLSTAYAHLSAYGAGLAVGMAVTQGQQIALSGNTGLSSGPHLHYEVIVNGQQVDSQTFQTEEGHSLNAGDMALFLRERDRIDAARTSSL